MYNKCINTVTIYTVYTQFNTVTNKSTSTKYRYLLYCQNHNSRNLDFFATFYYAYVSTSEMNLRSSDFLINLK